MIKKLVTFSKQQQIGSIVVMADFIIDRIIKLKSKKELFDIIKNKSKFGSGAVQGIRTYETKGGKAVNLTYALAKLGAKVTLFTIADKLGASILDNYFSDFKDKVDLRIKNGKQGYNTAFEFLDEADKIFLADIGDNDKFGPQMINTDKEDIEILKNASAVAIVDWAGNLLGTDLVKYVFEATDTSNKSLLYFIDMGDIQRRTRDIPNLLQILANTKGRCVLSINENECNSLAKSLNFNPLSDLQKTKDNYNNQYFEEETVKEYLKRFANKIAINIDLHANNYTAWSDGERTAFSPTRKVKVNNLVGAGDTWDAADIIGYLAGLDPQQRLVFANAYVSLYIESSYPNFEPSTMKDVLELLLEDKDNKNNIGRKKNGC